MVLLKPKDFAHKLKYCAIVSKCIEL